MHEARADPRREAASRQRQDRHAHPHGVRRCGVGAVWQIVEEEIGERVAGEMLRFGPLLGEDQALGRDALLCGLLGPEHHGDRRARL